MDIKTILTIVGTAVGIIAYIVVTILAIKRKKAAGEPVDLTTVFDDIAGKVLTLVKEAEKNFAAVQSGGKMKLKDVLNDTKELCATAGIAYDKSYWTTYISKAVELINIGRDNEEAKIADTTTTDTAKTN